MVDNKIKQLLENKINILEPIKEFTQFETWWNRNLAAVIVGDCPYSIWLLVYEPKKKKMEEVIGKFAITNGYDKNSLENSKNKVKESINELNGDNPILAIINTDENILKKNIINEPYIIRNEIPHHNLSFTRRESRLIYHYPYYPGADNSSTNSTFTYMWRDTWIEEYDETYTVAEYPDSPDDYLKPLDIIKIRNEVKEEYFFAIYLGKKNCCCLKPDNEGVRLENWDKFLENAKGELTRYHLVIPFIKWESIIVNIARSVASNYKKGKYGHCYNNQEHYVWEQITGISYSQEFKFERFLAYTFSKLSSFVLRKEIKEDSLVNLKEELIKSQKNFEQLEVENIFRIEEIIREIKRSEVEWKAQIVVPTFPISQCKLM